ncbi:MAG: hypothetical protein XD73_0661 [Anaerolinea thermophila]|uniref:Uncharacterized protein n=1 Tax=Anaerolinea thermophila TaxID=167964 RepID=A0A117LGV9_9CHLR|nr:MAG: hypothetical protein XD73_0661 [Anaerolinea thermophila]
MGRMTPTNDFGLTKGVHLIEYSSIYQAGVAELADALRSGRSEHYAHVGSNPTFGMKPYKRRVFLLTTYFCRVSLNYG